MKNWGIILIGSLLTTQSMGQLKTINPIAGKIIDSNPALKACVNIPQPPTPDNPIPDASDPNYATYYGCVATPPVPEQVDRDHWTSRLLDANGNERTGTYRKNGQWCAGQGSIPTADCPIEVLAYFSINCGSTTDPTTRSVAWSDGTTHCPMLDNFSVNHVTRMAVAAPGLPVLKEIKAGPGGDTIPVVIPKGPFIQELVKTYKCPNTYDVVVGQDQYGYPVCDSQMETQITKDENTEKTDVAALQKCIGETADMMAGKLECTTACTPQHCKYKLFNRIHTVDACQAMGSLANVSDGSAVSEATSSNTTFCRMTGDHCPRGWANMVDTNTGNWWTTTADGNAYTKHTGQNNDYCQTSVKHQYGCDCQCGKNGQNLISSSLPHPFSAVSTSGLESHTYYQINPNDRLFDCCHYCTNGDFPYDQNPGNVDSYTCTSVITEVGCY